MSQLFLDSSFAIAAKSKRDQHHGEARGIWPVLMQSGAGVVTTSFVISEIIAFLISRSEREAAIQIGEIMLHSHNVDLIHVDAALFAAGWDYFIRHRDKDYSLTDCVSFIVIEQRGLRLALTFDRHFVQAGFERLPVSRNPG
jgi:predicted nucleic acid-binding protein